MRPTIIIVSVAIVGLIVAALLAVLSRHKKSGTGDIRLVGEIATVESRLDPEGTVIVRGELWSARSNDGSVISPHTQVRVVGFKDLLALVEICE